MTAEPKELPTATPPAHLRPLVEFPALRLAEGAQDLRGKEVRSVKGELLGTVSDLLADPDRLVAEFLTVATAAAPEREVIVPLSGLEKSGAHLVPGRGLEPIVLRYQSTLRLTLYTSAFSAALLLLIWIIWSLVR